MSPYLTEIEIKRTSDFSHEFPPLIESHKLVDTKPEKIWIIFSYGTSSIESIEKPSKFHFVGLKMAKKNNKSRSVFSTFFLGDKYVTATGRAGDRIRDCLRLWVRVSISVSCTDLLMRCFHHKGSRIAIRFNQGVTWDSRVTGPNANIFLIFPRRSALSDSPGEEMFLKLEVNVFIEDHIRTMNE